MQTLPPPVVKRTTFNTEKNQKPDKPDFNQWSQMNEEQEEPKESKSPSGGTAAKPKQHFLARGTGKAGGVGKQVLGSTSKTPVRQNNKQP